MRMNLCTNALLSPAPDCVLCGMYELDSEHRGSRKGALSLLRHPVGVVGGLLVDAAHTQPLERGVFDITTLRTRAFGRCVGVSCGSRVLFYRDVADGALAAPDHIVDMCEKEERMITSTCVAGGGDRICSVLQGGTAVMYDFGQCSFVARWAAHEYDAWCAASMSLACGASTSLEDLLLTGGDDGMLKVWDPRQLNDDSPVCVASKRHDAGVVTIVPCASMLQDCEGMAASSSTANAQRCSPFLVLVGSYDEHVYLYDVRSLRSAVASASVGGGAWRIRAFPSFQDEGPSSSGAVGVDLAVAAMQGGAALLAFNPLLAAQSVFRQTAAFHTQDDGVPTDGSSVSNSPSPSHHDGVLVYDVVPIVSASSGSVQHLATCSFYNKVVKLWKLRKGDNTQ